MNKIDPGQNAKRPGSAIAGASGSAVKKRSGERVVILEEAWLDALKHLNCTKWSKMRLVSHQLNGVVQRNVSRLPLVIVDSVEMRLRPAEAEVGMIVSDFTILSDDQNQWFKDHGMTNDLVGDIQLNNAIIDLRENYCVELCALGPAQGEKLTPHEQTRPWFFGQQFKANVLFYAEFNPHRNKYSWAFMAIFLKLLYDPSTYIKKLSMYVIDKKMKEIMFPDDEKRYIRCRCFTIQAIPGAFAENLCESGSWLEQNVQADIIKFPSGIFYDDDGIYDAVSNYILDLSWISASQVVKLGEIYAVERFFGTLIKKFPTVAVERIFPTVVFKGNLPLCCDSLNNQLSGKSIIKEKLENTEEVSDDSQSHDKRFLKKNSGKNKIYTISNGLNQMRIKFIQRKRRAAWMSFR